MLQNSYNKGYLKALEDLGLSKKANLKKALIGGALGAGFMNFAPWSWNRITNRVPYDADKAPYYGALGAHLGMRISGVPFMKALPAALALPIAYEAYKAFKPDIHRGAQNVVKGVSGGMRDAYEGMKLKGRQALYGRPVGMGNMAGQGRMYE